MAETSTFGFLDPVDDRSASVARSQAIPQVLARRNDQRRLVILVERAQPDQVRSVPFQLDPCASASRWTDTSAFNRSISAPVSAPSAPPLKICQEEKKPFCPITNYGVYY